MSDPRTADPAWTIEQIGYDPLGEQGVESRLALSNGFLGVHGAPTLRGENVGPTWPATYVAGLFDATDTLPRIPMLMSSPDWLCVNVLVDGKPLMRSPRSMDAMRRALDMRRGLLLGSWPVFDGEAAAMGSAESLRLASMAERSLGLQTLALTFDAVAEISVEAAIATTAHDLVDVQLAPELGVWRTHSSGRHLAMASTSLLTLDDVELAPAETRDLAWRWLWTARPGQVARLQHWVTFARSQRGQPHPGERATAGLERARRRGVAVAIEDHAAAWTDRWRASDVVVEGDPAAQQALNFAVYHMNSAANPDDERVSIGARALTGDAYLGHVFWDTEIFLLPFYTLTWPEAARTLLMYRWRSLDGARYKAKQMGWRGAFFAWESTTTGREAAPAWVIGADGAKVDILSGREEEHIVADVAYAVWGYWQATEDEAFLRDAGAELLFETARFWSSRAQLEADGSRHIRDVEGPDEYHEDVDDIAFTNVMACWNLRRGLECAALLKQRWPQRWTELSASLELGDEELALWLEVAETLVNGFDAKQGLYEQFAGFFELEHIDLAAYAARTTPMDVVLGRERIKHSQVVKQADVVALLALLPDEIDRTRQLANFRYYEPRCDHSSSLSPAMHALVAARLGDTETALRYFRQAVAIDLGEPASHSAGGVHIANQGGLWQTAVFGFAGLTLRDETISLDPHLPAGWEALAFPVQWRGRRIKVRVERGGPITVTLEAGAPLTLAAANQTRSLTVNAPVRLGTPASQPA
jgi:trehalose/maltose hydrolase-like predicted phosphorylase